MRVWDSRRLFLKITLKAARTNADLTQGEMADKMGVPRLRVIEWETGKRRITHEELKKWAELCNLPADFIRITPKR